MDSRTGLASPTGLLPGPEEGRLAAEGVPVLARDEGVPVLARGEGVLVLSRGPETVCHRPITADPVYYPQAVFHGRTIYFCTETCQSVFLSDPERFYTAHSKRRP